MGSIQSSSQATSSHTQVHRKQGEAGEATGFESQNRCPVDHSRLSRSQLDGFMHRDRGRTGNDSGNVAKSGCPVDHSKLSGKQSSVMFEKNTTGEGDAKMGDPKVRRQGKGNYDIVYDVYGQEIDKSNMMPTIPNQLPAPGQDQPLSTERERSSIPKAGEDEGTTWVYPSPQMFYNSLRRKGKADGVQESDMDSVVAIHNGMNERTWGEVMQWEQVFHCSECENPKLKRFCGRPHDLSPAARFRMWFRGYPTPFDRHDWIVDRCGLKEVRYIIDYYYREGEDGNPIEIHVRPALDSAGAIWDRLRSNLPFGMLNLKSQATQEEIGSIQHVHATRSDAKVVFDELDQREFDFLRSLTPQSIEKHSKDIQISCKAAGELLQACGINEEKCKHANMSLNYCMAQKVCAPYASAFMKALEENGDEATAYSEMTSCLDRFQFMVMRVMMEAAGEHRNGPEYPAGRFPKTTEKRGSDAQAAAL